MMPRANKSKYSGKRMRQEHPIEQLYEERCSPEDEAERRAWATVNKMTGSKKKESGAGRGKKMHQAPARKGGRLGGAQSAAGSPKQRSTSAKKGAKTQKRRHTAGK